MDALAANGWGVDYTGSVGDAASRFAPQFARKTAVKALCLLFWLACLAACAPSDAPGWSTGEIEMGTEIHSGKTRYPSSPFN